MKPGEHGLCVPCSFMLNCSRQWKTRVDARSMMKREITLLYRKQGNDNQRMRRSRTSRSIEFQIDSSLSVKSVDKL
jgi:hypothetical protein